MSRWRIYRATASGSYLDGSLLIEIIPDSDGVLATTYVDNGTESLKTGLPTPVSQTLVPSVKITAGDGGSGGGHVENPILFRLGAPVRINIEFDGTIVAQDIDTFFEMVGTQYAKGHGPVLTSAAPNSKLWRVEAALDGSLRTVPVPEARAYDVVHASGEGPLCFAQPGRAYRLEVQQDGALTSVLDKAEIPTSILLSDGAGGTWVVTAPETGTDLVVTGGP